MCMRSCLPAMLSFDQAVALPVVWITAHHCFVQAQLRSLHEVLVHAASGGVGLVSVEWVMRARATALATAGGLAKHALLRSCDIVRLSSSRNAAASVNLLSRHVRGRRLNSLVTALSNDFVSLSLSMLAPQGVFLELGKNRIWSHGRTLAARRFVNYVAVAVDDGCHNCPGWNVDPWWFNSELKQLSAHVLTGEVQPLLFEGFMLEEHAVQAALLLLQRGANLGKVIVRVGRREPKLQEHRAPSLEVQVKYRARERGTDFGTLICLGIDAERGIAVLELHDPQRFNTMDWAQGDDVARAVHQLHRLGGVRALALQGAGSTFCAGGNPFGSRGLASHAASCQQMLESVQVCLRAALPCANLGPLSSLTSFCVCCVGLCGCA